MLKWIILSVIVVILLLFAFYYYWVFHGPLAELEINVDLYICSDENPDLSLFYENFRIAEEACNDNEEDITSAINKNEEGICCAVPK